MNVDVTVLVHGNPVTVYYDNYGKKFIEGRPKSTFNILIENKSSEKILCLISLDGINIVTNTKEWKTGYIIESNSKRLIDAQSSAKPLIFSKIYSHSTNEGVIGVRVYNNEKEMNKFDKFEFKDSIVYYDDYNGLKERGIIRDKREYYPLAFN